MGTFYYVTATAITLRIDKPLDAADLVKTNAFADILVANPVAADFFIKNPTATEFFRSNKDIKAEEILKLFHPAAELPVFATYDEAKKLALRGVPINNSNQFAIVEVEYEGDLTNARKSLMLANGLEQKDIEANMIPMDKAFLTKARFDHTDITEVRNAAKILVYSTTDQSSIDLGKVQASKVVKPAPLTNKPASNIVPPVNNPPVNRNYQMLLPTVTAVAASLAFWRLGFVAKSAAFLASQGLALTASSVIASIVLPVAIAAVAYIATKRAVDYVATYLTTTLAARAQAKADAEVLAKREIETKAEKDYKEEFGKILAQEKEMGWDEKNPAAVVLTELLAPKPGISNVTNLAEARKAKELLDKIKAAQPADQVAMVDKLVKTKTFSI